MVSFSFLAQQWLPIYRLPVPCQAAMHMFLEQLAYNLQEPRWVVRTLILHIAEICILITDCSLCSEKCRRRGSQTLLYTHIPYCRPLPHRLKQVLGDSKGHCFSYPPLFCLFLFGGLDIKNEYIQRQLHIQEKLENHHTWQRRAQAQESFEKTLSLYLIHIKLPHYNILISSFEQQQQKITRHTKKWESMAYSLEKNLLTETVSEKEHMVFLLDKYSKNECLKDAQRI